MCPTAERRSAGFTLLELLVAHRSIMVRARWPAGARAPSSVERNPLYTGAQALVTVASSTARSRALLLANAPVTLELGQTFMEISSENGDRLLRGNLSQGHVRRLGRRTLPARRLAEAAVPSPRRGAGTRRPSCRSGQDTLSVDVPATGTARILRRAVFLLEQIRKEFL